MTQSLAILTVRNEAAFLLEWFAHHRACGFTDFLVFSNDCTDGTDLMLDRLQGMGWLTHVRNGGPHPKGPQWTALKLADRHPARLRADWILVLDIDEFVNIHAGDHRLGALFAALPQATAIPLTWRLFGNAGIVDYTDAPVTRTFTRAAPSVLHWPWRAALFKTLFRDDGSFAKLGVHRPRQPDPDRLADQRWFDGSGRPLAQDYASKRLFSDYSQNNVGLVQLNHYALGAMESYILKCDRGRANRDAAGLEMGYWVERNFSDVEDRSIDALAPCRDPILADLHADAILGDLHRRAVDWRKARFASLMAEESARALFGRLLMTPPSRALSRDEAQQIIRHATRTSTPLRP